MARQPGTRTWRLDLPNHEALEGLSESERLEVIEQLNIKLREHPTIRGMTIVVLTLAIAAGFLLNSPIAAWLQSFGMWRVPARMLGASMASLATVIVGLVIGYWIFWNIWRRAFRGAMREIGRDVCLGCGYWLRGLDDEIRRCPECGFDREQPTAPSAGIGD